MKAMSLISTSLAKAAADGEDLAVRGNMALASTLAGMVIAQVGVVAGHGFTMSIGEILGTSHGRTVGILLPHIMRSNLPEAATRVARLADCFQVTATGNPMDDASKVVDAVTETMKQLNFPTALGELGVSRDSGVNLPPIPEESYHFFEKQRNDWQLPFPPFIFPSKKAKILPYDE